MSDITLTDTCDAIESAEEIEVLAHKHAKRTGRYEESTVMLTAAAWIRRLEEDLDRLREKHRGEVNAK